MEGYKIKNLGLVLERLAGSILLAGFIIFIIGLYYWIIKAGIPPQDPPLDIQIKYAVNQEIGSRLIKTGLVTAFMGVAIYLAGRYSSLRRKDNV